MCLCTKHLVAYGKSRVMSHKKVQWIRGKFYQLRQTSHKLPDWDLPDISKIFMQNIAQKIR